MHTHESSHVEVAYSKLAAARAVAAEALEAIDAGDLEYASERIDKAGGKLLAAAAAIQRANRQSLWQRFLGPGS